MSTTPVINTIVQIVNLITDILLNRALALGASSSFVFLFITNDKCHTRDRPQKWLGYKCIASRTWTCASGLPPFLFQLSSTSGKSQSGWNSKSTWDYLAKFLKIKESVVKIDFDF